jgi:hypothetical protein
LTHPPNDAAAAEASTPPSTAEPAAKVA